MVAESLLTAGFGLTFGGLAYYSWRQRDRARREMERNQQLAEIGAGVDALAHDLENLLMAISLALPREDQVEEVDVVELCRDIERGLVSATKLVRAIRVRQGSRRRDEAGGSVEGLVRLVAALLRRKGARIKLAVTGDFEFRGPQVDAIRVVHNLVFNALEEAEAIEGGYVRLELDAHELRVLNPVGDSLPDRRSDVSPRHQRATLVRPGAGDRRGLGSRPGVVGHPPADRGRPGAAGGGVSGPPARTCERGRPAGFDDRLRVRGPAGVDSRTVAEAGRLKVAFIGSHGVGKTTLCYGLAARLKARDTSLEMVHEVARRCPLPINEETGLASQGWILHTQIAEEIIAAARYPVQHELNQGYQKKRYVLLSSTDQSDYVEMTYELYGHGGVGIIAQVMTDNKNRISSEMNIATNKKGGSVASPGSVTFNFEQKGVIQVLKAGVDEDELFLAATDAGAEDFDAADEFFMITTAPDQLFKVKEGIEAKGFSCEEANLEMIPKVQVDCDASTRDANMQLIEWLENLEDVDAVFHNMSENV